MKTVLESSIGNRQELRFDLPETAEGLTTLTASAEAEGVFGVPSMLLDGELFWGLDSLPTLEWRLS